MKKEQVRPGKGEFLWKPNGTLAYTAYPWTQACGEQALVCDGTLNPGEPCPHVGTCPAYEPNLDIQAMFCKLDQARLDEHTSTRLSDIFWTRFTEVKCEVCVHGSRCRDKDRPHKMAKCKKWKQGDDKIMGEALLRAQQRLYEHIVYAMSDYKVLGVMVERARARLACNAMRDEAKKEGEKK
jgi:hypothetical protein